jgi:hypothetical protein
MGTNLPNRASELKDQLRDQMHQLLFTDLQNFVVAVTPLSGTGTNLPAKPFKDFAEAGLKADNPPAKTKDIWVFAVASISMDGSVSYQAFKINWADVKKNIEEGMTTAVTQLVLELPADASKNIPLSLDLKEYKKTELAKFWGKVAQGEWFGKDTVDAEALYVRLAYMARRIQRRTDAAAITDVLASLGSSPSVKYILEYVCPAWDASRNQHPRRKDRD